MTASISLKLGDFGGPGLVVYNYKRWKEEIKYSMTQMTIVGDKLYYNDVNEKVLPIVWGRIAIEY